MNHRAGLRLSPSHVNRTLWLRWHSNLHQGSPLAKLYFGQVFSPCLDSTSEIAAPIQLTARSQGYSLGLHHRNTAANWQPANCKWKTPPGTGSLWGKCPLALSTETPHHEPERTSADVQILGTLPHMSVVGKFTIPSAAVWAFPTSQKQVGLSGGLTASWAHTIPGAQLWAYLTPSGRHMPEMLNSGHCCCCPPLLHEVKAHIHWQTVSLTDFPDGISPSQRTHTLPPQIMKPKPSKQPWQRRYCLTTKHWGPF